METKSIYEAPELSVVELAIEGNCCLVQSGIPNGGGGFGDFEDGGDIFSK